METVIVERELPRAVTFEELQQREQMAQWCLDQYRVKFLHSYLSRDGMRMICVYHAPDAEAVRDSQRKAEMPFSRVWVATCYECGKGN